MSAYALFLLVTILVNGPLSPVLPAAYEPILIYFGPLFGTFTTATLGTIGILFVEYVNYRLHQKLLQTRTVQRIVGGALVQRVVALFSKRPALTVWLCAWSPLPYWPVRLLSPLAGLSLRKYLVATGLGRFPQYLAVIALGSRLHLSTGALGAIIVGSSLLTLGIWLIKRLLQRPATIVSAVLVAAVLLSGGRPVAAQESHLQFGSASAQQSDPRIPDGRALGFTIDRFRLVGEEEGGFTAFTFHITQLKRDAMSPDIAIGTFPQVLAAKHLALTLDADVAFNIALPRVTILPRAGASSIVIAGAYASGFSMGYNFGASIIINFKARDAIRFDITRREYLQGNFFQQPTLTIGIGVSGVPSRNAKR